MPWVLVDTIKKEKNIYLFSGTLVLDRYVHFDKFALLFLPHMKVSSIRRGETIRLDKTYILRVRTGVNLRVCKATTTLTSEHGG